MVTLLMLAPLSCFVSVTRKVIKRGGASKRRGKFPKDLCKGKAPSFPSIHMGVKAEVLPPDTDFHHFVLEDEWKRLEEPYDSIFLSITTVLDPSLAPDGHHILHIFTNSSVEGWKVELSPGDYEAKKERVA